jgi:FKBP12-rapamycin complex-associated protein
MQLFGLINTLLANDRETANRHLSIQRYAIIPLSPNSGLIGWVPNHDTLHILIRSSPHTPHRTHRTRAPHTVLLITVACRDYRESRKILLNLEHKLMVQMASNYDELSLIQKVLPPTPTCEGGMVGMCGPK